jgi:hypothetical protein
VSTQAAADDFARRFAAYWSQPTWEGLSQLLRDDVRLVAPLTPPTEGLADGRQTFAGILELIPDITGTVHRWGPHNDGCFIEFTLAGTLNGAPISWRAVDAFELDDDGMALERVSFFDPTPLLAAANDASQ